MSHLGVSPKQYWGLVGGRVHSLLLGVTVYLAGCLLKICLFYSHLLCIKDFTTPLHLSLSYFHFQTTFSSSASSSSPSFSFFFLFHTVGGFSSSSPSFSFFFLFHTVSFSSSSPSFSFSFILSAFPPLPLFHTVEYTGMQKQKWSLLLIIISFTCLTSVFTVL